MLHKIYRVLLCLPLMLSAWSLHNHHICMDKLYLKSNSGANHVVCSCYTECIIHCIGIWLCGCVIALVSCMLISISYCLDLEVSYCWNMKYDKIQTWWYDKHQYLMYFIWLASWIYLFLYLWLLIYYGHMNHPHILNLTSQFNVPSYTYLYNYTI